MSQGPAHPCSQWRHSLTLRSKRSKKHTSIVSQDRRAVEHSHKWWTTNNGHVWVHSSSTALLQLNTVGNLTKNHVTVLWTTHTHTVCSSIPRERGWSIAMEASHMGVGHAVTFLTLEMSVSNPIISSSSDCMLRPRDFDRLRCCLKLAARKVRAVYHRHIPPLPRVCMRAQFSPFNARKAAPKSLHNVSLCSPQLLHWAAVVAKNQWPMYVCT